MAASIRLAPPAEDSEIRQFFEAIIKEQLDECDRLLKQNPSILETQAIELRVLRQGAFEGSARVCQWALQKFKIGEKDVQIAFVHAATFGHPAVCSLLLHNTSYITDSTVTKAFLSAARRGKFGCCKWLKEKTLSINDKTIEQAARKALARGHGDLAEWLTPPQMSLAEISAAYDEDSTTLT